MDDRNDPGHDNSTAADSSNVGTSTTRTRIGLDVGTSKVVTARGDSTRSDSGTQLNAFFVVPWSSLHESTLQSNRVPFFREGDELVVYGSASEKFAHMFNAEVRRPMARGVLNPGAPHAQLTMIKKALQPHFFRHAKPIGWLTHGGEPVDISVNRRVSIGQFCAENPPVRGQPVRGSATI